MPYAYRRTRRVYRPTYRRSYGRKSYGPRKSYARKYKSYGRSRKTGVGRTHFAYKKDLAVSKIKEHVILRYCSADDLNTMPIPMGRTYCETHFCINDWYWFLRGQNGLSTTPPTLMPMKTEWSTEYFGWRIHMVEFVWTCVNPNDIPYFMAITIDPINYASATWGTTPWDGLMRIIKSNTDCVYKMLMPAGSSESTQTIKWRVPIAKMIGNEDYRSDPEFAGGSDVNFNTSPLKVINASLLVLNYNGVPVPSGIQNIITSLNVNIYATLYAKKGQAI